MSTSRHISHLIAGSAFVAGLCLAGWHIVRNRSVQSEYRRHNSQTPKVSKDDVLDALAEVLSGAKKVVMEVQDAISGSSEESRPAVELQSRNTVQTELDKLQAAALKRLHLSADEGSAAVSYYTSGEGADAEVKEVLMAIKATTGQYVLTKSAVLDIMTKTYELQSSLMIEMVEEALQSGAIRSMQQLQRFLSGQGFQRVMQAKITEETLGQCGLSVDELDAITKRPEYMEDPVFQAGIAAVAERGRAIMEQANQQLGAMMQQLAQQGGGRGGMGGMGMGMGF